jgi:hypothetical protein
MTLTTETPLDIVTPVAAWELVTPERAAELLETNTANRGLRLEAVHAYARDIAEGRWMVTGESIKIDWTGRLIDGQHRLAAVVEAGVPVSMLVISGLDPIVQRVIDVNVRRTAGDALRMLGVERNVYEVASAARLAIVFDRGDARRYGTIRSTTSHAEIFAWVEAHPEIDEAAQLARRLFTRLQVPPSPLTYAIWRLSQINAVDTLEFFQSAAEYATTGEGDPRAALLRVYATDTHRIARRPLTIVGVTFAAWNAWRDKQKVKSLPLVDAKGNAMLIETPV